MVASPKVPPPKVTSPKVAPAKVVPLKVAPFEEGGCALRKSDAVANPNRAGDLLCARERLPKRHIA